METHKSVFAALGLTIIIASVSTESRAEVAPTADSDPKARLLQVDSAAFARTNRTTGFERAPSETLWWGGLDQATGLAIPGGVWDFEDGTQQGWTSFDLTDIPVRFRHVTIDSCLDHNDPECPVINGLGSLWVGWHEDEATALCWPGGQGYGNGEAQYASKLFTYAGTGSVTLTFDYFVDSETQFDYTYVYVVDTNGIRSPPLNTSMWPNGDGNGYSGSNVEGTGIGSPDEPAQDMIIVDNTHLPDEPGPFEVVFQFDSDPLFSDALDSYIDYLDSWFGPFGVDDVRVLGVGLDDISDFEPTGVPGEEYDGWVTTVDPSIGTFLQVARLDDLDEVAIACQCPIAQGGNQYVMVAADISDLPANFPHPKKQHEIIKSPSAYVGGTAGTTRLVLASVYRDLPLANGVGYRTAVHYYPWTCPETSVVGWTLLPVGSGGFRFAGTAECAFDTTDVSIYLPTSVDSLRVVFELIGDCDDFGTPPESCTGPEQTNQSPYWDDVRLGVAGAGPTPLLQYSSIYQDCYPEQNSLLPDATAWMFSNGIRDSAVVRTGLLPDTEVYIHVRTYPGPMTNVSDPFFTRGCATGDPLAPSFAKVRLDTAETQQGVEPGFYATYYHEDDPCFTPPERVIGPNGREIANPLNRVLPADVFTPGTTIEYFFTANFTGSGEQTMLPDTTTDFREVQVLPGYFLSGSEIQAPCFLYNNEYPYFSKRAQGPIEDFGLRPYLGTAIDDDGRMHDLWDRFDDHGTRSFARRPGDTNGATQFQSMIYRTILFNSDRWTGGLTEWDADLYINFLTNDDFGRHGFQKSLWLNGNGVSNGLLNGPSRLNLLVNYCGAMVAHNELSYRDFTGDSTACIRLDPVADRHFPTAGDSYGSVRGNGCPGLMHFTMLDVIASETSGNQAYVDQDAGGGVTPYASVSNNQFVPTNAANYGVVLDGYSLHLLRSTPDGWTGSDCGADTSAISRRVNDALAWLGVPGEETCPPIVIGTPEGVDSPAPAVTRLHRNSPNPFNPKTTIRYELSHQAHVQLVVFDVMGRAVRTLVDQLQTPGRYGVSWDGRTDDAVPVASGVFWVRMSTSRGFKASTKMVVLK